MALLALLVLVATAEARGAGTRDPQTPGSTIATDPNTGCCNGPAVLNYGNRIDFGIQGEDSPITDQYRPMGVLFGHGATPLAPETVVRYDPDRGIECPLVLNGDPPFRGWEFLIFVNPVSNRWSKVQKIGAVLGYCDVPNSVFIAAYGSDGELLESKFNTQIGFEFISIERPTADICRVLIGDCQGGGAACYPDPAGTALNCLTFSTPIQTTASLPDTVQVPDAPHVQGTPAAGTSGLIALGGLLLAAALFAMRPRRAVEGANS